MTNDHPAEIERNESAVSVWRRPTVTRLSLDETLAGITSGGDGGGSDLPN
jgi:hypothetical protein